MKTQKVAQYIVKWLQDYVRNAGVNGFVIGVSGGIDSAVTASLCAETGLPVLVLELPIHQAANQVSRAQELIAQLQEKYPNVQSNAVDLTHVFEAFKKVIPSIDDNQKVHLSLANTRARLRMTTLYYLAGLYGYIVAGTGNKVEDFGVGFFTKYGDGGVDISPIADLMKSEVYELGTYLQVPKSILQAAPTDGLFGDNRTDEEQLGATYDELEWAMRQTSKEKKDTELTHRQTEVLSIYTRLHRINQHKMQAIPVCVIPEELK